MEEPILQSMWMQIAGGVLDNINSSAFYYQLAMVAGILATSLAVSKMLRAFLRRQMDASTNGIMRYCWRLAYNAFAPLASIVLLSVLLQLAKPQLENVNLLIVASRLALAWLLIRTLHVVMANRLLRRVISIMAIVMAVLSATNLLEPTAQLLDAMAFEWGKFRLSVLGLLKGILVFSLLVWLARVASKSVEAYIRQSKNLNYNTRELIIKLLNITIYFLIFVITLNFIGIDLTALAVFGGALGVGIGFGLQKITSNFISGLILLFEKSIKLGDLLTIGEDKGWVRQLAIRYTLIETFDGREMMIPNEDLIANKVTNWTYTTNRARIEIPVGVAYGTDPVLIIRLLEQEAKAHPRCLNDPAPTCVLRAFGDSALNFLLTFWVADVTEGLYAPQSDVMLKILERFKEHSITIPFPTRTIYASQPLIKEA